MPEEVPTDALQEILRELRIHPGRGVRAAICVASVVCFCV